MTGRVSVHVDTGLTWGGGQEQALTLVRALRADGESPLLVVPPGSALATRARGEDCAVRELAMRGDVAPRASWELAAVARARSAQLLHAHSAHAHGLLMPVTLALGLPLVVTRRNMSRPPAASAARRALEGSFTRRKYRAAAAVLCVSAAVADDVAACGAPRARIHLAPTAVTRTAPPAPEAVAAMRARCDANDGPLLVALGSLEPVKNHAALLRAAAALRGTWPRVQVAIGGEGSLRGALADLARTLGLADSVHLLGHLDDPLVLLAAADLVVHPSWSEGAPGAVLEALAQARPVVATRVGGVAEIVGAHDSADPRGWCGVLVPPGDDTALREACAALLADREAAQAMGARGRARVLEDYSAARMVAATRAVYDSLSSSG